MQGSRSRLTGNLFGQYVGLDLLSFSAVGSVQFSESDTRENQAVSESGTRKQRLPIINQCLARLLSPRCHLNFLCGALRTIESGIEGIMQREMCFYYHMLC